MYRKKHLGVIAAPLVFSICAVGAPACSNHETHADPGGALGPPAKGGLDVRGDALFVALGNAGAMSGEIAVIDLANWRVAGRVKVANNFYPHHLGLSPDGTRIAVGAPSSDLSGGHTGHGSATTSGALFIMDGRTGDVLAQKVVNGTAHNLAYVPDGSAVVYALAEHNMFHVADPTNLAEIGSLTVGASPLEASPTGTGNLVLVSNSAAGTVSVVDASTRKVSATLTVGSNPIAAWIGEGNRAFVTSEADRKLSAIDLASLTVTETVSLTGTPGQAQNTRDGREVWVAYEDQGKVAILNGTDLTELAQVAVGQRPHGLALSPDGTAFFVTDESAGTIFEVDTGSRSVKRSLVVAGSPNGILLRPAL